MCLHSVRLKKARKQRKPRRRPAVPQPRPPRAPGRCWAGPGRAPSPPAARSRCDACPGPRRRLSRGSVQPHADPAPPPRAGADGAQGGSGSLPRARRAGRRATVGQLAYPSAAPCVRVRRLLWKRVRPRRGGGELLSGNSSAGQPPGAGKRAAARARPAAGEGVRGSLLPLALPSPPSSLSPVATLDQAVAAEGA